MDKNIIFPQHYDLVIKNARGAKLYDDKDKEYIDLSGSAGMCCLGYGDRELLSVLKEQSEKLLIAPQKYQTNERVGLADKLLSLFDGKYDAILPTVTGSETVEVAMQLAVRYTGKKKFLSFSNAYHGRTIASGSLGECSGGYGMMDGWFETLDLPKSDADVGPLLEKAERLFKGGGFAGFITEGVVSNAGYLVLPRKFVQGLKSLCNQYNVVLIFDEVLTGYGRTGKMFSFEHHDVEPDIVCLAKNIAAGYVAMGAVVTTQKFVQGFEGYSAYTWPPLGCALGIKTLELIEKKDLVEQSMKMGEIGIGMLRKFLNICPIIESVNGVGLGIGIKFNTSNDAQEVYDFCLKNGVVVFRKLNINLLTIQPPLIISQTELEWAIKIVIRSVVEVYNKSH